MRDEPGGGRSSEEDRPCQDVARTAPWLWGCLIISRQGRCLVHCMAHDPPGVRLHLRQVCNMMVAVQSLAGE